MKKGKIIGINNSTPGKTGEKYIIYDISINRYVVIICTHGIPKQKKIGQFKTLMEAVLCRDKYLSEYSD